MNNVYNLADAIIGPLKPQPARKAAFAPEPADIHKIELSIADPRLDDYLANVGPQLLCLCPSDQIAAAVGFEIPEIGRAHV